MSSNRGISKQYKTRDEPKLLVRSNESGYRQYATISSNKNTSSIDWKFTHRRVAEKKIGRSVAPDEQVHHINRNKQDNRYNNLAVVNTDIHQYLHQSGNEKKACFRCGHSSHHASECFASRDVFGRSVQTYGNRNVYYSSDSSDSDDSDCGYGCARCGRSSHTANSCFAKTDVYGNSL